MNKEFFVNNRSKLFNLLDNKSIVVLQAGDAPVKSADESYVFTPNRNFYYLTGVNESRDILVMIKDGKSNNEIMIINEYDELKSKWVGKTYTKEEINTISGVTNIEYLDKDNTILNNLLNKYKDYSLYIDFDAVRSNRELEVLKNDSTKDVFPLLTKLRMVKEKVEIDTIIKANQVTKLGLEKVLKELSKCEYENQAESYFDQTIKFNNASGFAFRTIAASGANACVLHYDLNNSLMNKNDLILFDLGAEYNYYKSDVSRTYPIGGKYSDRQKELYNIVLNAQKEVFKNVKAGLTTKDLNNIVIDFYAKELKRIGLIKEDSEVKKYYFHGVSHHLGLDTHDVAVLQPLEEGNVITVEPGLYIEEESIGIRIEDDILITKDGYINLSEGIIKEVSDIEKFMK